MLVERISLLYTVFNKTAQNQVTQVHTLPVKQWPQP
jgi:hypothetical protein